MISHGLKIGLALLILRAMCVSCNSGEQQGCVSGPLPQDYTFRVAQRNLQKDQVLGKVRVSGCEQGPSLRLNSTDGRLVVEGDGTLRVRNTLRLPARRHTLSLFTTGSGPDQRSVQISLQYEPLGRTHTQDEDLPPPPPPPSLFLQFPSSSSGLHRRRRKWTSPDTHPPHDQRGPPPLRILKGEDLPPPVSIHFPSSSSSTGLRRRKREWTIPPISFTENHKGPYPYRLVQIKSTWADETAIMYGLTGPGADQNPVGIFRIIPSSGWIEVTQRLDREQMPDFNLRATATVNGSPVESPVDIIIKVIDQNDNKPSFTQITYEGAVPESASQGFEILRVTANDKDEPNNLNSEIKYSVVGWEPQPNSAIFFINSVTGGLQIATAGLLDRENVDKYKVIILAADLAGEGFMSSCTVMVTVTDANDNPPQFSQSTYVAKVPENQVGVEVVKVMATDADQAHTPNWNTRFSIISGNLGDAFSISSAPNNQDGIITTAKALDFEQNRRYTLVIGVENEVPLTMGLATPTATVMIEVEDVNEAPLFVPEEKRVVKPEDLAVGGEIAYFTAVDPDLDMKQSIVYRVGADQGGWLAIDPQSGLISVRSPLDRESPFVIDNTYTATIYAVDQAEDVGHIPATGTGTLLIQLEDVNDNAPIVLQRELIMCNQRPPAAQLLVTDADGPGFANPYRVELNASHRDQWSAKMNDNRTMILLSMRAFVAKGDYDIMMTVYDNQGLGQVNTLLVQVCECTGSDNSCAVLREAGFGIPAIMGILASILFLLLLLLVLLLLVRRRRGAVKKEVLMEEEDVRDQLYYYDEEGGGEEDREFDLSQLHRGLDNRPEVYRDDVAPTLTAACSAPNYRPRPSNPDEIGTFILENLQAANNDPTAPPFDSLLVFDYEGAESACGSLSSLQSSSADDADNDLQQLQTWGPRFRKLADMYGGGEDEDDDGL